MNRRGIHRKILSVVVPISVVLLICACQDETPSDPSQFSSKGPAKSSSSTTKRKDQTSVSASQGKDSKTALNTSSRQVVDAVPASGAPSKGVGGNRINVGDDMRVFKAKTYDGQDINLEDLKGKFIFIDFWATWCRPCQAELPHVSKLAQTFKDKDDFVIIGVSLDKDSEAVRQFVSKYDLKYPQVFDGKMWKNDVAQLYGVFSIPFTILIGKDGKVLKVGMRGPSLVSDIEQLIKS